MSLTGQAKSERQIDIPEKGLKSTEQNTEEVLLTGVNKLALDFVKDVRNGKVKIQDIKDAKDLVTIMQTLRDMQTGSSDTPQIQASVVNFWSKETNLPEGTVPNSTELEKKISGLSSEDVDNLINEQGKEINNENAKGM